MEFLKEMDDTKTTSDSALRRGGRLGGASSSSAYGGGGGGTSSTDHHHHAGAGGFRPLHTRAASTPMGRPLRQGAYSQPNSPAHGFREYHVQDNDAADAERDVGRSKSPHARLEVNGHAVRPGSQASSTSRSRSRGNAAGPGSGLGPNERTRLIQRSYSTADLEGQHGESMAYTGPGKVAGGTVMGIHNLAIVFPQFIVSPIFRPSNIHRCAAAAVATQQLELYVVADRPDCRRGRYHLSDL